MDIECLFTHGLWRAGFVYNLVTHSMPAFEKPEGLLEVTVVEASGVPRMDLLGKASRPAGRVVCVELCPGQARPGPGVQRALGQPWDPGWGLG